MYLSLDVKRKLMARSDRVKSVDLHPTEPWTLTAVYDGRCHVWNYETSQLMKTFEICELPVRAAKFVVREQWVVTGSDDGLVRVFNYNTHERIHQWEAHGDYIRCILCHPTEPFIFTTSDDTTIKLWNWKDKWQLQQIFEGHTHYVMQMALNPKDHQQFVTASLDKMLKVWQIGTSTPSFTLTGHERGINCVDYCAGDRPYLASGADDKTIRIWDCQARSCVRVLDGHTQNVSAVIFHRELPILITGSEDATVRVWNLATFRLENTLNYGLERVWAVSAQHNTNVIAIGADEGTVVVKLGREEPVVSMDSSGKIVLAKNTRLMQINLKAADPTELAKAQDGERLVLPFKDLGACEFFPKFLKHSTNGRFVAACGYGEYIVYTAMALRHVDFGSAQEFAWSTTEASTFALLDSTTSIKIKKNFKDHSEIRADGAVEGIEGGPLLAARSVSTLAFYNWETGDLVRRLEVVAKGIYWSDSAELVAIAAEDTLFVLKYDADAKDDEEGDEDGIQSAFDVVCTLVESIKSALWIGDCLVFVNKNNRLCYYVGGETVTIAFLDRALYLLGYQVKESRIFAVDKDLNVVSYRLEKSVLEYETAVMRKEFEEANKILENVPMEQRTSVARFLEKQGFKKLALAVSSDMNHRFELALGLGDLELAKTIAETTESDEKWRALGQAATIRGEIELASECLSKARDFGGLMLLASSAGSSKMMQQVATEATNAKEFNVGFVSHLLLGHVDECLETLISSNRIPEAAFFARTYCPSQVPRVLELWKAKTEKSKVMLGDPVKYPNLFPDYDKSLQAEAYLRQVVQQKVPATTKMPTNARRNMRTEVKQADENGQVSTEESDKPPSTYEDAEEDPEEYNSEPDTEDEELSSSDEDEEEEEDVKEDELVKTPPTPVETAIPTSSRESMLSAKESKEASEGEEERWSNFEDTEESKDESDPNDIKLDDLDLEEDESAAWI